MDMNPAGLTWFALLRESRCHNDGGDPLHGYLAADFALVLRRRCHIRPGPIVP